MSEFSERLPSGSIVGAHLYSACKTERVASRPRRFRCETIGNVRYRIPRGRITRTLRANVKRTRRRERYAREREVFAMNPNGILSPLYLSLSLFLSPFGRLVAAATLPPDVWLSFWTVRNGFVRWDEPEPTKRVRANYFESKHDLPEQFISEANVVTFPLSNLTLFLGCTLSNVILVK